MFKELIGKVKTYENALNKIVEAGASELAEAKKHYGNGDMYYQKEEEVKWKTEKSFETMKNGLAGEIKKAFDTFLTEINDYISVPVPSEVSETIATLNATGVHMTADEAKALLHKYSDNYMVRRILAPILGEQKYGFDRRILDSAYADAQEQVELALKGIEKMDMGYWAMLLISDVPENPLNRLESYRNEFINVVKAGEPSEIFSIPEIESDVSNWRI